MKTKVYLAGGLKSRWQDNVIRHFKGQNNFTFFNPADHGFIKPELYTHWDLHYVKECDILFGYMESTNPSGYGLALEIGHANALGKTVILVDERSKVDEEFAKSYKFIREASNILVDDYEHGLLVLSRFHF